MTSIVGCRQTKRPQPIGVGTKREYDKITLGAGIDGERSLEDDIIERITDLRLTHKRLLDLLSGRRPHAKTTLDWMLKKRLITPNEYVAGSALALLLEWRRAAIGPEDSTVAFAKKFVEGSGGTNFNGAPRLKVIPNELPLLHLGEDDSNDAKTLDVDEIHTDETKVQEPSDTSASKRIHRWLDAGNELKQLQQFFKRAMPEKPELFLMLCRTVLDRIDVREIPYSYVPTLCSALYLLKERWREQLLEGMIDDAVSISMGESKRRNDARR